MNQMNMSQSADIAGNPYQQDVLDKMLSAAPFGVTQQYKEGELLQRLLVLSLWHWEKCPAYRRILKTQGFFGKEALSGLTRTEELPFVSVSQFKLHALKSIEDDRVFRVLKSSGTSGKAVSQVYLDKETAALQTRVLVRIFQELLGRNRRPMLIIDQPPSETSGNSVTARGAGITGLSFFGRDHTYALDKNLTLAKQRVSEFLATHDQQPVLVYGLTYLIWSAFVGGFREAGLEQLPPGSVLIHGGGWKKLIAEAVSPGLYKQQIAEVTGIEKVIDFYGMAEQVGSVFPECEHGKLHAPYHADIIVRDPLSLKPVGVGQTGLIQLLSMLPMSYPGHSLLTEDLGTLLGVDDCPCGRPGRYFQVNGRLPATVIRGCSNTLDALAETAGTSAGGDDD